MNLIERLQLWAIDPFGPLEETLKATQDVFEPIASHYAYGALPAKYQAPYARMRKISETLPTITSCIGNSIYNLGKIELASEFTEMPPIINIPLWGVKLYAYAAIISSAARLTIMSQTKKPVGTPTIRILDDVRRGLVYLFNTKK